MFGSLLSTFAFANIFASLWIGSASDKFGRHPLLVLSLLGMAVAFFANAFALSLHVLFTARFCIGFFAGIGSTGRAYMADVTTEKERPAAMASLGGITMLGYAGGPPLGAAISFVMGGSRRMPFAAGGLTCTAAAAVVVILLPNVEQVRTAMAAAAAAEAAQQGQSTEEGSRSSAADASPGTSDEPEAKAAAPSGTDDVVAAAASRSSIFVPMALLSFTTFISQTGCVLSPYVSTEQGAALAPARHPGRSRLFSSPIASQPRFQS